MDNNNFRGIPTSLSLNGPELGIVQNPQNFSETTGTAEFSGIATASFISGDGINDGTISFKWYYDGQEVTNSTENITITGEDDLTGTKSTLSISNVTTSDHGKEIYYVLDYIPTAYSQPAGSVVTAETARSTGNAFNDFLQSSTATLSVTPTLSITTQPTSQLVATDISAVFDIDAVVSPAENFSGTISYQWQLDGNNLSDGVTGTLVISGSQTKQLTLTNTSVITGSITCVVTTTGTRNNTLTSDSVSYQVVLPRNLLAIEYYNYSDTADSVTTSSYNLDAGDLDITHTAYPGVDVCLYAPEQDIDVEVELYGGSGESYRSTASDYRSGGDGGFSRIRFTMQKNEEYIITGLFSTVNTPYLYRKATLIAAVGAGGNSGKSSTADGGDGGGVGVSGQDGFGDAPGTGGQSISAGNLTFSGIFGSCVQDDDVTLSAEDIIANEPNGGRVIPCSRGTYWRDQGNQPCDDLGNIRFRSPSGTELGTSAQISRGYKSGYSVVQTRAAISSSETDPVSGSGATGGNAATSVTGGHGGGSGYTDGSVTVAVTQQGGGSIAPSENDLINEVDTIKFTQNTTTIKRAYREARVVVRLSS